ncbi:rhodanese-like domain-containing protein [Pusillimonas sp. SM2304]|uniref:rhodanese-like domain-containing protein n=1 Tax=Pusillimonas sp. SM2304 TaxID=3073241 RepID=UPI00287482C4|nr:rhodanese-like domain-containing protein [Pusillimonas sp. SM2304]MDS1139000.1 rhodanese-like domain-containing protein [Pusillimonas sp. SM2304]
MADTISFDDFDALRRSDQEWALFDIRETAEADAGHIPGATFLPRRMIELRIADLAPDIGTEIVVYDDGNSRRVELARESLVRLGYTNVRILNGGFIKWMATGRVHTSGTNVPGKFFGERIHETRDVPFIPVKELKRWQDEKKDYLVCDIRTPTEYADKRIPTSQGAFGVDLASLAHDLQQKSVPIIVHCSGRTRGIIACQTLRELGVQNVYALENGTMGWQLEHFDLEKKPPRGVLEPTPESVQKGKIRAKELAHSVGVAEVSPYELSGLLEKRSERSQNVYIYDVRQVHEYRTAHLKGSLSLPGGLAIQRVDDFMPVRRATSILVDDDTGRAHLTAFWLKQFGCVHACVLSGGLQAWKEAGFAVEAGRKRQAPLGLDAASANTAFITAQQLSGLRPQPLIVHVDTSRSYESGRVPGAIWIPYGWLEYHLPAHMASHATPVVLTCRNGAHSIFAASNLKRWGYTNVSVLEGGLKAWADNFQTENGWPSHILRTPDTVTPPYESGLKAMARYLAWELRLTESLSENAF